MKVFTFHLMPYADLDMTFMDKHRAAWVVLPNTYYDPKKGHELYNRYLDELELAADWVDARASPFLAHSDIMAPAEDRVAPATSLAAARIESSISRVVLMK